MDALRGRAVSKYVAQASVCALLFELSPTDIKQPLQQFQHVPADANGIRKLMVDIDEASPDRKLGKERVERLVDSNWQRLSAGFENARQTLAEERKGHKAPERTPLEVLTGILEVQQGVLVRLQNVEDHVKHLHWAPPGPYAKLAPIWANNYVRAQQGDKVDPAPIYYLNSSSEGLGGLLGTLGDGDAPAKTQSKPEETPKKDSSGRK